MKSSFPLKPLGDVAHVRSGYAFKSKDWIDSGIPVVKIANVKNGELEMAGCSFVSTQIAEDAEEWMLNRDDILIAMTGYIGDVARVRDDAPKLLNQRVGRFENCAPSILDNYYLFYALRCEEIKHEIARLGYGSAQPNVSPKLIQSVQIPLPSLREQHAIAGVLGSLDDKIEQNRWTARALERLAGAIFRAWFVGFEPVKAKAAGATAFDAMPQAVFDALPTSLLGSVPEGWEVKALGDVAHLTMGQSPKSEYYNESGDGLPFHQGVTDYGFRFPTHRVHCTVDARIAEPGDVLLSVRAPVGRINVADRRLILGRGLAGLRDGAGLQSFLFHQLCHVFEEEDAIGDGTIYKAVTKQFLAVMPTLVPPTGIREAFNDITKSMDALVMAIEVESRKLAEMRDYLLPKLLSGEVRVKIEGAT